ncbi:uncharacterized protein LOC111265701 isoform X2 [Varroa jacobsoni]|uniref:uncharacterized protein LOC111265701 isoform X2 n=1 Tax=Varroa jacobsoni TaxID=62625 RepID=UPI000BF2C0E3|nr:uncharacterized protein LOC111265701 isoform X2 [Varroa jacobsoni]
MWCYKLLLQCTSIWLLARSVFVSIPAIERPLKEALYIKSNMEPITVFATNTSNSVLEINATEKAMILFPLAQSLIFDTMLTNYTESMCNELSLLDIAYNNETFSANGASVDITAIDNGASLLVGNSSGQRRTASESGGAVKVWCSSIWDGISCWPPAPPDSIVAKSCHLLLRAIDDSIPPDISHPADTVGYEAQHDTAQHRLRQHDRSGLAELYAFRTCGPGGAWLNNITNYNACIAFLTQYHATPAPPVSMMPLAVTCILVSFSAVSLAFLVAAAAIFIHFSLFQNEAPDRTGFFSNEKSSILNADRLLTISRMCLFSLSCPRTRVHLNLVWALTLHSLCMIIISLPVVINAATASHNNQQQQQQQQHQQHHHQQQQQQQQVAAAATHHLPSSQHQHAHSTPSTTASARQRQQQQDQLSHNSSTQAGHRRPGNLIVMPNILSTPSLCKVTLCAKMYSSMSSINWMFVEGLLLHSKLTTSIFRKDAPFPLYYAIGWGLPILFIIPWGVRMELELPGKNCWEGYGNHSWVFLLIAPRLIVLVTNLVFLINIIRILVMKAKNNSAESTQARKAIKATLLLFPLLGITHLLFCINPHENDVTLKNTYMIVNALLQSSQVRAQLRNAYLRAAIRRNPNRKSIYSGRRHIAPSFSQRQQINPSQSKDHTVCPTNLTASGGETPGKLLFESSMASPSLDTFAV